MNLKKKLAEEANDFYRYTEDNYKKEIESSFTNSVIYTDATRFDNSYQPEMEMNQKDPNSFNRFLNNTTYEALLNLRKEGKDNKIALLNFASFKYPGGGFLKGVLAQEEDLCRHSILYNVLSRFSYLYHADRIPEKINNGLYINRSIYSKDIIFFSNRGNYKADVITCTAPNLLSTRANNISEDICIRTMISRIHFILKVAAKEKVNILVLGAFGCGVFRNDPAIVATIFRELTFSKRYGQIESFVYAIPYGRDKTGNALIFDDIIFKGINKRNDVVEMVKDFINKQEGDMR